MTHVLPKNWQWDRRPGCSGIARPVGGLGLLVISLNGGCSAWDVGPGPPKNHGRGMSAEDACAALDPLRVERS